MQGPQAPDVTVQLPIAAFGPWTWPHSSEDGCQPVGATGGSTSDAWPFGMCTLKAVKAGAGGDEGLLKSPPLKEASEGARREGPGRVGSARATGGCTWPISS